MRFPDKPGLEIRREHLPGFEGWLCQLKADGWRCLVSTAGLGDEMKFYYTSCSGKDLCPAEEVRRPFEERVIAATKPGQRPLTLDCEMMGNRREGDVKLIVVIDVLEVGGQSLWDAPADERFTRAVRLFDPFYGPGTGLVLPGTFENPGSFFDHHKDNSSWAEGVVLKRRGSVHVGSTRTNFKNKAWIKCKWRAGESGTTPKE